MVDPEEAWLLGLGNLILTLDNQTSATPFKLSLTTRTLSQGAV